MLASRSDSYIKAISIYTCRFLNGDRFIVQHCHTFVLSLSFMAKLTSISPCQAEGSVNIQFFQGRLSPLSSSQYLYTNFHQLQLPSLNQQKEENDIRNYCLISLQWSYVTELGLELVTPGSAVR